MRHDTEIVSEKTWRVRLYRPEDKASLLRLSAFHYGDKELGTEAYFDWLYGGGPAGPAVVAVAEVLESGEIIGFIWHVPFQVNVQGVSDQCHLGCNGLVHPDYRRQGVYLAFHDLVFQKLKESLFIYGFPKPVAVFPLRKAGIFQVSPIPLLVRPLDMAHLAQVRLTQPALRLIARAGWWVSGSTIWRPGNARSEQWGLRVASETGFDERFDRFWERIVDKYDIMLKRDRAFLTWRFCSLSFRSYETLTAQAGDELVGYTVLRCMEIEGVRTGLIVDLLVEPGAQGEAAGLLLVEAATQRFREARMDLAGCLMLPHTQEYAILRRAGYLECPERFAPQAFRLTSISLSPRLSNEFFARASRWFVTMANHDAV